MLTVIRAISESEHVVQASPEKPKERPFPFPVRNVMRRRSELPRRSCPDSSYDHYGSCWILLERVGKLCHLEASHNLQIQICEHNISDQVDPSSDTFAFQVFVSITERALQ